MDLEAVPNLSYPTLLGVLGLENTPPGGATAIQHWLSCAPITPDSSILDVACSTGFSGRMMLKDTKCHLLGFDIDATSVQAASMSAHSASLPNAHYVRADASSIPIKDNTFSHALVGSAFGFFSEREQALDEIARVLQPGGHLFAATFCIERKAPERLIQDAQAVLGFNVNLNSAYWESFFSRKFKVLHNTRLVVSKLPIHSLLEAVHSQAKVLHPTVHLDERTQEAILDRWVTIRMLFNELRDYQKVHLLVLQRLGYQNEELVYP